jgi:hypothetical protein
LVVIVKGIETSVAWQAKKLTRRDRRGKSPRIVILAYPLFQIVKLLPDTKFAGGAASRDDWFTCLGVEAFHFRPIPRVVPPTVNNTVTEVILKAGGLYWDHRKATTTIFTKNVVLLKCCAILFPVLL